MNEAVESIGTIVTGGIVGHELEGVRGRGGHGEEGAGGACANCGAIRYGPFCHACGQSGHIHRNLKALGHDLAHGVLHFEGKTWNTLPMLALHPGELTRRYIHGERARFVSPMALFLFAVFLLFASVSWVSSPATIGRAHLSQAREKISARAAAADMKLAVLQESRLDRLKRNPKADVADLDQRIAATRKIAAALQTAAGREASDAGDVAKGKDGPHRFDLDAGSGTKGVDVDTGSPWLDRQIGRVSENPALFAYKMKMASYKFSWVLIPISVPFIWLLFFWRRDAGLYDHAIFAIYSLSFMTLLVVGLILLHLIGISAGPLVLAILLVPPLHIYRQLKGAYRLGRLGALWRTAALLMTTTITSSLFALFLFWLETD